MKILSLILTSLLSINNISTEPQIVHHKMVRNGIIIHTLLIPKRYRILPAVKKHGETLSELVKDKKAIAGINGGYFNHSDGFPVSYVFINNVMQKDPRKNKSLINNKSLRDILPKIFDQRSELREIYNNGQKKWVIVPHISKLDHESSLKHSIQAGPNLLPTPNLEQEGFITKSKNGNIIRDGIASQSGAARSAIGINKNGDLILVAVSSQNKYHGMSINQLSDFMKELGCISAMGFDGGSSTTLVWKENEQYQSFVGSGQSQALINSALLIFEP